VVNKQFFLVLFRILINDINKKEPRRNKCRGFEKDNSQLNIWIMLNSASDVLVKYTKNKI
jgi:hypothetical protein